MDILLTIPIYSTSMFCRCKRVVIQLNQFMYLRKSFETISEEHEIDPMDYDEVMSELDAHPKKKATEYLSTSSISS